MRRPAAPPACGRPAPAQRPHPAADSADVLGRPFADPNHGQHEGNRRGYGADQKAPFLAVVLAEPAAQEAGGNRGRIHGSPLNGLQAAGQAQRLAAFHHQGVHHHVGKRDAHGRDHQQPKQQADRARLGRNEIQVAQAQGRRRRGQDQVAPPARTGQRQEVRNQPVQRLDRPGQRDQGHERADLGRRLAPVVQQRTNRLGDQSLRRLADPLDEIDRTEQQAQPDRIGPSGRGVRGRIVRSWVL